MDGTCKFNASNVGATIKSWTDVASGSEPDLQKVAFLDFLTKSNTWPPPSVTFFSLLDPWYFYKSACIHVSGGRHGGACQCCNWCQPVHLPALLIRFSYCFCCNWRQPVQPSSSTPKFFLVCVVCFCCKLYSWGYSWWKSISWCFKYG